MIWIVIPILVFGISVLGGVVALNNLFGSYSIAFKYLRGERLILEPEVLVVKMSQSDSGHSVVNAEVFNYSDRSINILGANTSCSCVVTDQLPVTISAGGVFKLPITLHAKPNQAVNESIVLYTDSPQHERLRVRLTSQNR